MTIKKKIKNRFSYLGPEKLAEILDLGKLINLKEGEIFIANGSHTQKIGVVVKGLMRNYIRNDNGEQITVVFADEMQAIAPFASLFLNQPGNETCEAVEPTLLFVMDFAVFKKRAETDLIYARIFNDVLQSAFVAAARRIEDFTHKKPEQRYERLLQTHGHLADRVPLKHLASYLGITPVSLSRIRKRGSKPRN